MMVHLAPPSVRAEQASLTEHQAVKRAWFELARSSLAQADVLQRFENLSYHYGQLYRTHEACESSAARVAELEASLDGERLAKEELAQSKEELLQQHQGCPAREAELSEQLLAAGGERDRLKSINDEQARQIRELEGALAEKDLALKASEAKSVALAGEVEKLTVGSSQAEILRHNYVRQLIPTVFKRFRESDEYQMAWADVFNAALNAGWVEGVKTGRTNQDEIDALLASKEDLDMAAVEGFQEAYDQMFVRPFPYLERIASSFRLPLADLMNIQPAGEVPTVGAGASNMASSDQFQDP